MPSVVQAPPAQDAGSRVGRCALCGARETATVLEAGDRRFGTEGRFALARCRSCGLLRTEPQPDDLSRHYPSGDYYSYRPPRTPSATGADRARAAYGLPTRGPVPRRLAARIGRRRLAPGLPPGPPGAVLDVGCGSGEFLLLLARAGWRCHGIELDAAAVEAAHAAGLDDVRAGELVDAGYPPASFDAVRFWHSLEHVRSPRDQLREARRVLRAGGTLTIGVPNAGSLLARVARERWYYLDIPRHLWHFDRERLARLVADCGFRVERVELVSTSSALLGTLGYATGLGERLVGSRPAWYATLPAAAALDALRAGDAIELVAIAG